MTVKYAVTFEFDMRPPVTYRGITTGGQASTCMARAVRLAAKALRPIGWSSVVCVLLERADHAKVAA